MNWERLFTRTIRDRGYTYYRRNKVKNLEIGQNTIEADVTGTHRYHVLISMKDHEIKRMYCNCPYADDGHNCKHMAAVLYEWEDRLENDIPQIDNENEIEVYYKEVEDILEKCHTSDRFMGVDYFIQIIMDYIDRRVILLHLDKRYMDEFNVLIYIYVLVGELGADASCGNTGSFMDRMHQLWSAIYDKVDNAQKEEIYSLCETVLEELENVYICDVMIWFILNHYDKYEGIDELYEERLDHAKNLIIANDWANAYTAYLENFEIPEEFVDRLIDKYWNFSAIKKYYINCLIEWKQYEKALKEIKECSSQDDDPSWYTDRLMYIYELQDDKEMLKKTKGKMLFDKLVEKKYADIDTYRELRDLYTSEEWIKEKELLMKSLSVNVRKDLFYYDDKDYEGLMRYLIQLRDLGVLEVYEDLLENDYSSQLLELYASILDEQVKNAKSRSYYKFFASTLRKMKHFKGGQEFVKSFVAKWQEKYKTRYALMEELEKV